MSPQGIRDTISFGIFIIAFIRSQIIQIGFKNKKKVLILIISITQSTLWSFKLLNDNVFE